MALSDLDDGNTGSLYDSYDDESVAEKDDDIIAYLAPMIAELSRLASANQLGHLAYLLDIARLEAESLKSKSGELEH